ncbi:MAG TPA: MoxR family ATPase, partial [Gaiellaceae bacterium]|nr:MoxR family ATPase [Gaiellaceae bacterium]
GLRLYQGTAGGARRGDHMTPMREPMLPWATPDEVRVALERERYVADRDLAVTLFLSLRLGKPIFLEGEAGVGKTEVAKVLASGLGRRLIRLQCYEGLDLASAVYEWDHARQILEIRLAEAEGRAAAARTRIYSEEFLIKRPLLDAIDSAGAPAVLLIDEVDRADEEFEAYLLDLLSDFQITVPELGTFRATAPPPVVITSNRTREVHDALKRRCLYQWIDYPTPQRELAILSRRLPDLPARLARSVVAVVQALRREDLFKRPGVAETLDWALALTALGTVELDLESLGGTLGVLLKYEEDVRRVREESLPRLLEEAAGAR